MAEKKIIAVIGATGAQGGGLARAILEDRYGSYAVRAVTRNAKSEKAQALAAAGAQVVEADLDKPQTIKIAFDGAYGAYCVTNFWEHFLPAKELSQATNMAQAAKNAGLKQVIWSTLEDTRKWVPLADKRMPTLMGQYKVPHFDAKGEANDAFRQVGVPTTFLLTSFYWENLIYFGMGPRRTPEGLVFSLPMGDKKLPGIAVEDIGKCALGVFKRGVEFIGKTVGIAGEHLTCKQMAASLSRAFGEKVSYVDAAPEEYRKLGFPGAEDLANMFHINRDFEAQFCNARDLGVSRSLNPSLQTFDGWLMRHKEQIPRE
jgi:uncharacterized protein YbjT (DUF2867 family)